MDCNQKPNIALTGLSGAGKTSVGARLAEITGKAFIDTDAEIERESGMPVSRIFEVSGEAAFRRMEIAAVKKAASANGAVIATGGGCVLFEENVDALSESCVIVYLKRSVEKIAQSLENDATRPLLKQANKQKALEALLAKREPLYAGCADFVCDATDCGVNEAALKITDLLNSRARPAPRGLGGVEKAFEI